MKVLLYIVIFVIGGMAGYKLAPRQQEVKTQPAPQCEELDQEEKIKECNILLATLKVPGKTIVQQAPATSCPSCPSCSSATASSISTNQPARSNPAKKPSDTATLPEMRAYCAKTQEEWAKLAQALTDGQSNLSPQAMRDVWTTVRTSQSWKTEFTINENGQNVKVNAFLDVIDFDPGNNNGRNDFNGRLTVYLGGASSLSESGQALNNFSAKMKDGIPIIINEISSPTIGTILGGIAFSLPTNQTYYYYSFEKATWLSGSNQTWLPITRRESGRQRRALSSQAK